MKQDQGVAQVRSHEIPAEATVSLLWLAFLPVAAIVCIVAFIFCVKTGMSRKGAEGFWILAALLSPFILFGAQFFGLKRYTRELVRKAFVKEVRSLFGGPAKYANFDDKQLTGIAIKDDQIVILHNYILHVLPVGLIRDFTWVIEGTPGYAYIGLGGALAASFSHSAAKADAVENSGLFLSVSDVKNPRLQFRTTDESFLHRWTEILTQTFERYAHDPRSSEKAA
jgi:hypothetical protein